MLNGVPTTVVGVMPARFTKQAADLWRPVALNRADPQRQEAVLHLPGEAEAGRHARAGRRRPRPRGAPLREGLSARLSQTVRRHRRQLGRQHRRAVPRRRSTRWRPRSGLLLAIALLQRGHHAPRASRRRAPRDGGARLARREPRAADSPAARSRACCSRWAGSRSGACWRTSASRGSSRSSPKGSSRARW